MDPLRRGDQIVKDPIHTVPDFETVLIRFDVYVAGARFYGLGDDMIYADVDRAGGIDIPDIVSLKSNIYKEGPELSCP